MTSSLVGSEMCIRDSASRERAVAKAKSGASGYLANRPLAPRWRSLPSTAVSYTHLTLPTICSV
eukprot:654448-Prorocentrum_lima.AAC.1